MILFCPFLVGLVEPGIWVVTADDLARHLLPEVIDDLGEQFRVVNETPFHDKAMGLEMSSLGGAQVRAGAGASDVFIDHGVQQRDVVGHGGGGRMSAVVVCHGQSPGAFACRASHSCSSRRAPRSVLPMA